jgi:hypothetical protein
MSYISANNPIGHRRAPFTLRALPVLLSLLLAACQSVSLDAPAERSQRGRISAAASLERIPELDTVPFFPDNSTLCGPSTLASIINHAGLPVSVEELTRDVYLPGRKGALQVEMLAAIRRRGLVVYQAGSTEQDLRDAVRNGFPVLVLLNLGLEIAPSWHYAVVVGFENDPDGSGYVLLRSGTERRQRMQAGVFANVWARSERWAQIAAMPDRIPTHLPSLAVYDAVSAFARQANADTRYRALESAMLAYPDDVRIRFAFASEAQAQGKTDVAEMQWRELAQKDMAAAAGANLAHLLDDINDAAGAVEWACKSLVALPSSGLSEPLQKRIESGMKTLLEERNGRCTDAKP